MVGASHSAVCGVRDYNRVAAQALTKLGCNVSTVWWERDVSWGLRETARQASDWLGEIGQAALTGEPDFVLWQYSAFSYGRRGVPHLAPAVARALDSIGAPVVTILHEFASPFRGRGWRGAVHAATTRAVLPSLVWRSAGLVVTTEARARTLEQWLPRRPVLFAPVFSNVSPTAPASFHRGSRPTIGVFGFRSDSCRPLPVVAAITALRRRGLDPELVLVGAPGDGSPQAVEWRHAAAQAGCSDALRFTGVLAESVLAQTLTSLDTVVLPVARGPEPRQGTLAACLAHGLPVVAFDGPHRWRRLTDERALVVTPPDAQQLTRALASLLHDTHARMDQAERAHEFYRRHLAPEVVAADLLRFLCGLQGGHRRSGAHQTMPGSR
jgi:glycosyltransferase involved in cell wall biosynthesis